MNEARMMDTADRFVNCKCAKYYLRSSAVDTAIETAALFTRVGTHTHTHTHAHARLRRRAYLHYKLWTRCSVCGFSWNWHGHITVWENWERHFRNFTKLIT